MVSEKVVENFARISWGIRRHRQRTSSVLDDIRLVATRPPASPTAVYEHAPDSTPRDFALDPNHPNPFNSSTTIGYRLDKAGKVRL